MLILLNVTLAIVIDDGTAIDSPDTTLLMHTNDIVAVLPYRRGSPGTIFVKFCMMVILWLGNKMA